MSDQWMMAMTKAIEVVDAKSASLDALTSRYTDMLDSAIDRMSGIKMAPVSAPNAPTTPTFAPLAPIDQNGPGSFSDNTPLKIDNAETVDIGRLLDALAQGAGRYNDQHQPDVPVA